MWLHQQKLSQTENLSEQSEKNAYWVGENICRSAKSKYIQYRKNFFNS